MNDYIDRVICADCMDILPELPDDSVDMILTDPPYNIGKDGWDRIKNYYDWLMVRFKECERVLKENGTFWFFHINFTDLSEIHKRLQRDTCFRHKQLIVINKGIQSVSGRCNTDVLRSFPRATEYLQFYTFDDLTGAEQLSDEYARVNPMAQYLKKEFGRAGVTQKEVAKLFPSKTGGVTGCVSNWILGYNFPLKWQYERMRDYLNDLNCDEDLRREYEDLRYNFNLPMGVTDVWTNNFYESKTSHPTEKPLPLIRRIIRTASNEGDVILDPFIGSGTTAVACRQLKRHFIGIELDKTYYQMACERSDKWKKQQRLAIQEVGIK